MEVLRSTVDPVSDKFKYNEAAMRALVEDLAHRHARVLEGGSAQCTRATPGSAARCCRASGWRR